MQTTGWTPFRSWMAASALLAAGTILSAVIEATALDLWIHRPAAASVTTLVPGMAYASATVMKVCLVGALLAGVIACAMWLSPPHRASAAAPATRVAAWSLVSIALVPCSLLAGAIAVLAAQALLPVAPTLADFPRISRIGVLAMMAVLAAGVTAALAALRAAERPRSLAMAASMLSLLLLGLFWHLQLFVLPFDQDTWAR